MGKLVGYIVCNHISHSPYCLGCYPDAPDCKLLLHADNEVHIFNTYQEARAAIKRTERYGKRRGLPWDIPHGYTLRVTR